MKENTKFPDRQTVEKGLIKLKSLKWPEYNSSQNINDYIKILEGLITENIEMLPNFSVSNKNKEFNIPMFRVRALEDFNNISLYSEHSYPPAPLTKKINRCNFPFHPVFYCSTHPFVALLEVIRKSKYKEKKFCISKWSIIPNESNHRFQSFLQSKNKLDNEYDFIRAAELRKIENEQFKNLTNKQAESFLMILKYLQGVFIDDKLYNLSASFSHRIFYPTHIYSTDIMMYPSVQSRFKGVNMAIHPNYVDQHMKIDRLYIINLNDFSLKENKFNVTIHQHGRIVNNRIRWFNLSKEDKEYEANVQEDFGKIEEVTWNENKNKL
ncbi:MAG: RES domain-containing protein [Vicingaceae bacterium]